VLVDTGLVQVRQEGRFRYYRLDPAGMAALRQAVEMFWSDELEQLAATPRPTGKESAVPFEKAVLVPLGPDETFTLLTDPERLRRWQAVTARIDLRAGGEYRFTITPGHAATGTVTEVEPGRRIRFTWGWEGDASLPPGASTVTITLEPEEGGTRVTLVHDGLTAEQRASHGVGWTHYLERLVAMAHNGDAGSDEWATFPDPLDELAAAESALASCQRVLRGLRPDDGTAATPCPEFSIEALVGHLVDSISSLGKAAGMVRAGTSGGSPENQVAEAGAAAIEAWRHHDLAGNVVLRGGEVPARLVITILPVEILVHAWDFAEASAQELEIDDRVAAYVLELARTLIVPEMRDGPQFGAEVPAGPDASNLARLVAFTGRRARTPAASASSEATVRGA
jgi:uncharacterized protein (TIGR03086 family)